MANTKIHGEQLKDSVVRFTAKAGESITKGQAVYISGISGELPVVSLADADDTAKMPAFGLAEATVSTNAEVDVVSFGTLAGLDTSGYSLGDTLYVDTTAGALTNDPAGGETLKLQNIGKVQRVHASNGSIKVGGAGRTNATPNLDDGDVFIGDSNNKAVSDSFTNVLNSEAGISSSADATAISIDSSENVTFSQDVIVTGDIDAAANIYVQDDIGHDGDADTYMSFETDTLNMYAGGLQNMNFTSSGVTIPSHSGYELSFTGSNTTNIRSDAGMFFLADQDANYNDPYIGFGLGNNNGITMLGRYKASSGTQGSATNHFAVSFGNSNNSGTLGSYNGIEPKAPFHILKGGLTMNGIETAGVAKYLHGASDSGQWMHMNCAGRSGSGVSSFKLYIPTAQSSESWGGFGGDLLLSGYSGQHSYIVFRGYVNGGASGAGGFQVSGSGSPTITVSGNGSYGFYIQVTNIAMTHPIAMYRATKGGNGAREWDLSEIYVQWG